MKCKRDTTFIVLLIMFNRSNCSAADSWTVDMATDGTCLIPAGPLTLATSVRWREPEMKRQGRRRECVGGDAGLAETENEHDEKQINEQR